MVNYVRLGKKVEKKTQHCNSTQYECKHLCSVESAGKKMRKISKRLQQLLMIINQNVYSVIKDKAPLLKSSILADFVSLSGCWKNFLTIVGRAVDRTMTGGWLPR